MSIQTYEQSAVIFRAGDYEKCMYSINSGTVEIYADYGTPKQALLTTLAAGAFFGEMAIVDARPRSATAVAGAAGAEVTVISTDAFSEYFRDEPEVILAVMRQMSTRIRELTQDYIEACKAVSEAVESGKTGKKSSWLEKHVKRFLEDYEKAAQALDQMDPDALPYNFHLRRMV